MQITDLQIGDYIACEANSERYCKVVQVGLDVKDQSSLLYIQNLVTDIVLEKDIESLVGIELTKDILKKNKWANDLYSILPIGENKYLQYYWHENRLRCLWNSVDEYEHYPEGTDIIFQCGNIKYVHELQHALKLCGLNDLAKNFKI